MPDYNNRIANWIYCNGSDIADQATNQSKHTIILYYYSMFSCHKGGVVYILGHATGSQERHICSIHKPLIKSAFPRHFTKTKPKTPLRYTLRQNAHFTPFPPLPTTPKITTYHSKIPSSPRK